MLVLTRKVDDVIAIGDDIRITVVEVQGGKVRLGISAPKDVVVDRQEVREAKQKQAAGKRALKRS